MSIDTVIYPAVGWRFAIGEASIALFEIAYARNLSEARAAVAGAKSPTLPIGLSAKQCRELAADLINAAEQLETPGRKSRRH